MTSKKSIKSPYQVISVRVGIICLATHALESTKLAEIVQSREVADAHGDSNVVKELTGFV